MNVKQVKKSIDFKSAFSCLHIFRRQPPVYYYLPCIAYWLDFKANGIFCYKNSGEKRRHYSLTHNRANIAYNRINLPIGTGLPLNR